MKVIGIDISGRDVRVVALDDSSGEIENCTGKYRPVRLEDDDVAKNTVLFKNTLFATIESFTPDVIVYNYRDPKAGGKYAPSPISFKIEGLIQLYENAEICYAKPQTITAYFKKNKIDIDTEYKYQVDALKLAYHYFKTQV